MVYSIIVPVFNRRRYIRRCLDSIIRQSYHDFELIVIDDGSDDGTAKICDQYEQRYEYIRVRHQQNGGVSRARNAGLKMAGGTFAIFVDSDDYLPSNYLGQLKSAYEKYGPDFWYCTSFKVYTTSGIQYFQYRKSVPYSIVKSNDLIELMDKALFNSVANKVYEMSLVEKYGIQFPEDISLGEDLIFNLRYLDKKSKIKFLVLNKDYYLVWSRDTEGSMERGWREEFFAVQRKLLKEKVKYINKWTKKEKISTDMERFRESVYYGCVKDSIEFYISHMKDVGWKRLIKKINEIRYSPEYLIYRRMHPGEKWILVRMAYGSLCRMKRRNFSRGEWK